MKRARMEWITIALLGTLALVAVANASATHWWDAIQAVTFGIVYAFFDFFYREAVYQRRRAETLDQLLTMEVGEAVLTAYREWLNGGQR
jgi:hypothetical protein